MYMGKFECAAGMGAAEQVSRANGTRSGMLKTAVHGKDVDVMTACPDKAVMGSCPNDKCLYHLGSCF
jgi:hypothetical protein